MVKKFLLATLSGAAGMAGFPLYSKQSLDRSEKKFRPDNVMLSENSGLFTLHTTLFRNSSLIDNNKGKTILIKPDFWLDQVDKSRLDTPWGQTFREFPPLVQQRLKLLYPTVNPDNRLTFEQMRILRKSIIDKLNSDDDFTVIDGSCDKIELFENCVETINHGIDSLFQFYPYKHTNRILTNANQNLTPEQSSLEINYPLKILMENGSTYNFQTTPKVKIFNFSTIPRPNEAMKKLNAGKDIPAQTELYKLKQGNEPKEIIVFGSGPSAIWVCEQASNSKVHLVMRNRSSKLQP